MHQPRGLRPFNAGRAASPVKEAHTLVIHHTAISDTVQAPLVERSHERRGYSTSESGSHIAYHFLVGKDGTVKQNRDLEDRTMHTRNEAVNDDSIAIVVAGNFEIEEPTRPQMKALRELIHRLDNMYHFKKIMPHRDASPTVCPGKNLEKALSDVWRGDTWNISRYYTPVQGQTKYYRTVSDKDFIHKAVSLGLVDPSDIGYMFGFATTPQPIGKTLSEADQWFKDRPQTREAIRKEMEYLADFKVNCSGDCLVTANGYKLKPEDAFKVAACPPEMPFGTKLLIEGIGTVTCVDRGGAIKKKRLDVWAGIGMTGLENIAKSKGGALNVTRL